MSFKLQTRILRLQTLPPAAAPAHGDAALISSFSVMCPDVPPVTGALELL